MRCTQNLAYLGLTLVHFLIGSYTLLHPIQRQTVYYTSFTVTATNTSWSPNRLWLKYANSPCIEHLLSHCCTRSPLCLLLLGPLTDDAFRAYDAQQSCLSPLRIRRERFADCSLLAVRDGSIGHYRRAP